MKSSYLISFVGSVYIFRHVLDRHAYSYHHVYWALVLLHVEIVSLRIIIDICTCKKSHSLYVLYISWEGFSGQGYDATFSPFGNFFRARLSPIVSGIVYIVYLVYIGKLLDHSREDRIKSASGSTGCFPSCWASDDFWVYRMAVGVFGVAFVIAFITQIQNGFSNRWHRDLKLEDECTKAEKYFIYTLGHLGFLARAGVFMFVAVFMFKALRHPSMVSERGDAFSDAINQVISAHGGFIGLWFLGVGLILFGAFAVSNAYYKYFPTPPPSRQYVYKQDKVVEEQETV